MEKRIGHRTMGKLAAAAAVGLAGFSASQAEATMIIDIRATAIDGVPTADAKNVTVLAGDVVTLQVFARVQGTNALNDEAFKLMIGSFRSSTGGLLGDLGDNRVEPPFNGYASNGTTPIHQNGSQMDVDSDGDLDIGPLANAPSTFNNRAFSANAEVNITNGTVVPGADPAAEDFLIGSMTFTAGAGTTDGQSTFIDFVRRVNPTGTNAIGNSGWTEDGVGRNGCSPFQVSGVNVIGTAVPEPTGLALAGLASLGLLARRRSNA